MSARFSLRCSSDFGFSRNPRFEPSTGIPPRHRRGTAHRARVVPARISAAVTSVFFVPTSRFGRRATAAESRNTRGVGEAAVRRWPRPSPLCWRPEEPESVSVTSENVLPLPPIPSAGGVAGSGVGRGPPGSADPEPTQDISLEQRGPVHQPEWGSPAGMVRRARTRRCNQGPARAGLGQDGGPPKGEASLSCLSRLPGPPVGGPTTRIRCATTRRLTRGSSCDVRVVPRRGVGGRPEKRGTPHRQRRKIDGDRRPADFEVHPNVWQRHHRGGEISRPSFPPAIGNGWRTAHGPSVSSTSSRPQEDHDREWRGHQTFFSSASGRCGGCTSVGPSTSPSNTCPFSHVEQAVRTSSGPSVRRCESVRVTILCGIDGVELR